LRRSGFWGWRRKFLPIRIDYSANSSRNRVLELSRICTDWAVKVELLDLKSLLEIDEHRN
jgi:hypothetical protein